MAPRTRALHVYVVVAAAGLLGIGSLLLFGFFLWNGPLGIVDLRMAQSSVLAWDAGLCLLFFLQHSGMVRASFRAGLKRIVPAYGQGLVYTAASGIALLALVVLWQPSAAGVYAWQGVGGWAMRGVLLLAVAGVLWGIRSLGEFDLFGIEAFLAHLRQAPPPPARLTIRGPYRLVRHPFYSFGILALWASPSLTMDRLILNALFTVWIVFGAMLEERDLAAEFGEPYADYRRAVPMFVPGLRAFVSAFRPRPRALRGSR